MPNETAEEYEGRRVAWGKAKAERDRQEARDREWNQREFFSEFYGDD